MSGKVDIDLETVKAKGGCEPGIKSFFEEREMSEMIFEDSACIGVRVDKPVSGNPKYLRTLVR